MPGKAMTKSEVHASLAETTGLSKKQVDQVFTSLAELIGENLADGGPGAFTIPGILKIRVVRKPATPAREGVNPFTGEKTTFAAKPARNVVKVTALKGLKDMV
jgi:nucleoid DNA-binding protein